MRNAGLNETCCQNEVSESKAPAASNVTSKVREAGESQSSLQADGVPFGGYKIDNRVRRFSDVREICSWDVPSAFVRRSIKETKSTNGGKYEHADSEEIDASRA